MVMLMVMLTAVTTPEPSAVALPKSAASARMALSQ
jgi:hypothetical protein